MASGFDREKYKGVLEQRYGKGSYEKGMSQAREIGTTRARADFEKAAYNQRVKAFEAEMKEQKKAREKDAKEKKDKKDDYDILKEAKKAKEGKKDNSFVNKNVLKPAKNFILDSLKPQSKEDKAKSVKAGERFTNGRDNSGFGLLGTGLPKKTNLKGKAGKAADEANVILANASNISSGGLFKNTILPMMEAFDDKDKKPSEKLKDLFTGNLDGSKDTTLEELITGNKKKKEPKYVLPEPKSTGGKVTAGLLGYGVGGLGAGKALNMLGKGGQVGSKALSIEGALERGKEGAAIGALMAGTEVGAREVGRPGDYNWKQNLGQIGVETAGGAILDPLLSAGGAKLLNKFKDLKLGNKFDDVTDVKPSDLPFEINKPKKNLETLLPTVNQTAATTARPKYDIDTLMKSYKGQDVPLKKFDSNVLAKQADDMPIKATNSVLDKPLVEADFTRGIDVENLKDISGFKGATSDVYRMFDDVFGKDSNATKRVLGELDNSKTKYVDMQQSLLKGLKENVVDKLGIKKGSKLSRYVQDYGEGNMDMPTLMAKAPKNWEKVVEADKWFRKTYDETIDVINASRAMTYPGDESKLVPKRKDYFRHYQELTGLSGLKNIFDTPTAIDPHLAGTSEFTKPGSKFAGFMQKRGLGPYKSDAVGGFLNYAPSASYATHIDPNIKNIRAFRSELADITVDSRNLNNFIGFLDKYANDLAGKTNPYLDRNVQDIIGRKPMAFLNWMNGRVKTNTILGNLSSTLAQVANVPMGISFAKQHAVKGVSRTMKAFLDVSEPIHKSTFMRERYSDGMYRKFDERLIEQPMKFAEWIIESTDRVGSSFIWNSAYEKGLKQGVPNPIKYADENTRKLIAGRGVGEVPLLQKSKVIQMVMPFTLEVGNQWYVMRDMVKTKDVGGLALLLIGNHVLNNVMEEIRGNPITFDPIDATKEAIDDDLSPARVGGRLAGEVLSNVPGGQYLAGLYPENGIMGGLKGPTREDLFEDRNPQRFGDGLVLQNGISDPAFKLIPSFGGAQLKKTLGGVEALKNGGSYKDGKGVLSNLPFMGETNELNFPIEKKPENILKSLVFGPYASNEAKEYFNNDRNPLSEKQTNEYKEAKSLGVGKEFYDLLMTTRRDDSVKRKLKAIQKDETLTDKQRKEAIEKVLKQLELK